MAIGEVIIHKIGVDGKIGYYEISSEHFNITTFYMRIDKSSKVISLFLTNDFSKDPHTYN